MDFHFTDEQALIDDVLRRYLRENYGFSARQVAVRSKLGWRREIWSAFAKELGLLGVALPEAFGGHGGGPVETMIVMRAIGESLVVEPFLETIVLSAEILARSASAASVQLLTGVLAGERLLAFAWAEPGMRYDPAGVTTRAQRVRGGWRLDGRKSLVTAAPWADFLIVLARTASEPPKMEGLSLFLVERHATGLVAFDYRTLDGRWASDLLLDDVRLPDRALLFPPGTSAPLVAEILDRGVAALAAEAVGVTRQLLDTTMAYTGSRRQFGQPLSSFQALQHRMVDMYSQVETAVSASYLATLRLQAAPAIRARAASAAKVAVGRACRFVGENAVQLHGGMGMTDEIPVGHYFKRALTIEAEFGDVDYHLARHARLSAAAPDEEREGVLS